jgi:hypothetical protein
MKYDIVYYKRSQSRQMKNTVFARFQRLVVKNFRKSWYISTEDLVPTKEACRKNSLQISFLNPTMAPSYYPTVFNRSFSYCTGTRTVVTGLLARYLSWTIRMSRTGKRSEDTKILTFRVPVGNISLKIIHIGRNHYHYVET